jgi:hypothetical protein
MFNYHILNSKNKTKNKNNHENEMSKQVQSNENNHKNNQVQISTHFKTNSIEQFLLSFSLIYLFSIQHEFNESSTLESIQILFLHLKINESNIEQLLEQTLNFDLEKINME